MILYIAIYAIIILLYLIFGNERYKGAKTIYFTVISILLILLACLRNKTVGNDVQNYVYFFNLVNESNFKDYISKGIFEPLYVVLNYFVKIFSTDYHVFLSVVALFIYIPLFNYIKKNSNNYLLSFSAFYGFLFFFESLSGLRQYISIGLIIYSIKYVKEKKMFKFILLIFLSFLFHRSAIICLIIYPLYYMKNNGIKNFLFLSFTIIISTLFYSYISSLLVSANIYSNYVDRLGSVHVASILGAIINGIIFFVLKKNLKEKNGYNNLYLNCSLVAFLLGIMSIKLNIIGRLSLYFEIFSLVSLPNAIELIKDNKTRILMKCCTIVLNMMYFYIIMYYRSDWYDVVPYIFMG